MNVKMFKKGYFNILYRVKKQNVHTRKARAHVMLREKR